VQPVAGVDRPSLQDFPAITFDVVVAFIRELTIAGFVGFVSRFNEFSRDIISDPGRCGGCKKKCNSNKTEQTLQANP